MNRYVFFLCCLSFYSCQHRDQYVPGNRSIVQIDDAPRKTYTEILNLIREKRKAYAKKDLESDTGITLMGIRDFWIKTIATDLYEQWKGTPWDFNGTAEAPQKGNIACGYFVTTILRDMDLEINRVKLSTCPSLQMMKSFSSKQKIINLSYLDFSRFDEYIKSHGKAVYIIGLDFHTGIIVNDGSQNWFIHSNYIKRQGVIKETVLNSAALRHSRTRWITSLTGNKDFLKKWVNGN